MAKILLVEDNEMNREMLSRRLMRRGFDVAVAEDGQEGVDKATSEAPDLILMDINLPVMDGWDATRLIKQNDATSHIPVIALTANAMSSDRAKALANGCDEYETKPVEFSRLIDKIGQFLPGEG